MELRREFIRDYLTDAFDMTELCDTYDISRKTGYKMVARFKAEGWTGLADRSRRPHHVPHAIAAEQVTAVLAARRRRPAWGARKVRRWLITRYPGVSWPSRTGIHALLQRHGLVGETSHQARPVRPVPAPRRVASAPNEVWTVDFKGDFRVGSGERCYPLTLRDLATRYTLRCDALATPGLAATQRRIERAFQDFGLPQRIRSDNGEPFAGPGLAGLSRLNIFWLRLGIRVEQIAPGRPDQNGSHEQFHRVLKAHTARPPAPTLRAQQARFDAFRHDYNTERPHEALNDTVPADHYRPSPRPWPRRLPPLEYPGHWEPRRVQSNGSISWTPQPIFLSRALAGELVALEEVDDGIWTVHFSTVPLARWWARDRRLHPLRTR